MKMMRLKKCLNAYQHYNIGNLFFFQKLFEKCKSTDEEFEQSFSESGKVVYRIGHDFARLMKWMEQVDRYYENIKYIDLKAFD